MEIAAARPEDRPSVEAFLREHQTLRIARRGELVHALDQPAVVAWVDGQVVGVATYTVASASCELLTLHAATRLTGVGSALVATVAEAARAARCCTLWVVTTNDNLDALRFYQRRGFHIRAVRPGAVDDSRDRLKPEIPLVGDHGIALRDEIELDLDLVDEPAPMG